MEIKPITDKTIWNDFLRKLSAHTFLQSWEWGEFNQSLGHKVFRFGFYDRELAGLVQTFLISARRGKFLFVPHGPLLINLDSKIYGWLLKKLREIASEYQADFLRISPLLLESRESQIIFKNLGFRPAPMHMHAERMWLLDIRFSEEELLSGMRKNCRSAIRKAQISGVKVRVSADPSDLKYFMKLYQDTAQRQAFVPFPENYIKREFEAFAESGSAAIFLGEHEGKVRSAALIIFTASEAFYHQGASVTGDPVPVSHLVQWAVILEAKRRGCGFYNFWGVSAESQTRHPWSGLSYFKRGFGGFDQNYAHAQDLPLSWLYWPGFLLETFRRYRRRL